MSPNEPLTGQANGTHATRNIAEVPNAPGQQMRNIRQKSNEVEAAPCGPNCLAFRSVGPQQKASTLFTSCIVEEATACIHRRRVLRIAMVGPQGDGQNANIIMQPTGQKASIHWQVQKLKQKSAGATD